MVEVYGPVVNLKLSKGEKNNQIPVIRFPLACLFCTYCFIMQTVFHKGEMLVTRDSTTVSFY